MEEKKAVCEHRGFEIFETREVQPRDYFYVQLVDSGEPLGERACPQFSTVAGAKFWTDGYHCGVNVTSL